MITLDVVCTLKLCTPQANELLHAAHMKSQKNKPANVRLVPLSEIAGGVLIFASLMTVTPDRPAKKKLQMKDEMIARVWFN